MVLMIQKMMVCVKNVEDASKKTVKVLICQRWVVTLVIAGFTISTWILAVIPDRFWSCKHCS